MIKNRHSIRCYMPACRIPGKYTYMSYINNCLPNENKQKQQKQTNKTIENATYQYFNSETKYSVERYLQSNCPSRIFLFALRVNIKLGRYNLRINRIKTWEKNT